MLCYCKSLGAAGSCECWPKVIACRLPIFYGLVEADGRSFVELFCYVFGTFFIPSLFVPIREYACHCVLRLS